MNEEATALGGHKFWGGAFGSFRKNPHGHEVRVGTGPGERLTFGFEKTIDHYRIFLGSRPPTRARGPAIDNIRAGIDRHAGKIGEENLGAVRNFSRIDCAMAGSQTGPVPTCALARSGTIPIDGDTCEESLLGSRAKARDEADEAGDKINKILHGSGKGSALAETSVNASKLGGEKAEERCVLS